MEVLAIIPARGGSKGLPRKNIRPLNGKPLIAYTIEESKKSEYINRIVVSTEDKEIAEVSNKYGAKIIKRPLELAKDNTPTIDVVLHTLDDLKNNEPDIIVLLQPTSPLRTSQDIDNAIKSFIEQDCDSVVSVCEIEHSPYWSFEIENNNYLKPIFEEKYLKKKEGRSYQRHICQTKP